MEFIVISKVIAATRTVAVIAVFGSPAVSAATQDEEAQYGAQLHKEMIAQREVVASSPLYDVLRP
ncbi:MAG TPA: hypothetical protein VK669_09320, partial [Candidatus Limnocylindrales bacterium]|nr:hypothetical protein [Candidatus Limnocylindrales bacterium]